MNVKVRWILPAAGLLLFLAAARIIDLLER